MRNIRTLSIILALATMPAAVPARAAATEDAATFVVKGEARAATPMTASAGGKSVSYSGKVVAWPTGTVKVLTFTKAGGGVLHPITDEKTVLVREGRVQATVDGKAVTLEAGDLASLPTGMLMNAGEPGDAVVVAWTAATLTPGATPAVVRGADVKPGGNAQLTIKRYEFPGNSVRAVTMAAGSSTNPNSAKSDSLIYLTAGRLKFFQDGQTFEVGKGDFIREVAGLMHNWEVAEDSGFVTTSALPAGAAPIDPSQATDRPKTN
ncbi:MAG: cupin domain-containing protein [Rhodospirillaceae bacterium]|nr:cupin domain-containing protein [Rhodospirillaceae bacterium]